MDIDLGEFKIIFLLESLYGTCTVSQKTLKQSKWKVAYSAMLVAVYALEKTIVLYNGETDEPFSLRVATFCIMPLPIYSLVTAMFDYKSKVSTALNLQAIHRKLESLGVTVPGNKAMKAMSWSVLLINITSQCWGLATCLMYWERFLPFTRFITTFQFVGSELQQGLTFVMFVTKIVMIRRAIVKELLQLNLEWSSASRCKKSSNRKKSPSTAKTENDKRWALLVDFQGSLQNVENTVHDGFWVQMICYRLISEVTGLMLGMSWIELKIIALPLTAITWRAVFLMCILLAEVTMYNEKKKANEILNNFMNRDGGVPRNLRKKHTLAAIHRARPFCCALFDVNFALLPAIMENALLVVTTMLGNSTNNA